MTVFAQASAQAVPWRPIPSACDLAMLLFCAVSPFEHRPADVLDSIEDAGSSFFYAQEARQGRTLEGYPTRPMLIGLIDRSFKLIRCQTRVKRCLDKRTRLSDSP